MTNLKNFTASILFFACFLFMLSLQACQSTSAPTSAVRDEIYRHDMVVKIDGQTIPGVGIVNTMGGEGKPKDVFKIHVYAPGDLDYFSFSNCHRDEPTKDAFDNDDMAVKETRRVLGIFKRKIVKKREIEFEYRPNRLEKSECPLIFEGGNKGGVNSWAYVDLKEPWLKLAAELLCSGDVLPSYGSSICQAKVGTTQEIKFLESVKISPTENCPLGSPGEKEGEVFQFPVASGRCIYYFKAASGSVHRLTMIGYDKVNLK